ncbi:MAG: hypothetical protein HY566_02340 [Candidatus Kerfeldbacteria bacterium]|nr:hypothetical protein [Candidatus Kerfeldbacteria bacterium]
MSGSISTEPTVAGIKGGLTVVDARPWMVTQSANAPMMFFGDVLHPAVSRVASAAIVMKRASRYICTLQYLCRVR